MDTVTTIRLDSLERTRQESFYNAPYVHFKNFALTARKRDASKVIGKKMTSKFRSGRKYFLWKYLEFCKYVYLKGFCPKKTSTPSYHRVLIHDLLSNQQLSQ